MVASAGGDSAATPRPMAASRTHRATAPWRERLGRITAFVTLHPSYGGYHVALRRPFAIGRKSLPGTGIGGGRRKDLRARARGARRRCDRGYGGLAANGGIGEGLEWLIGALWSAPEIRVGLGDVPPAGFRVVETYAVLPDARRAKFLIPLDDRRSAAASVASYNALRPPRVRAARAAVGAGIRTGAAAPFLRSRLKVCAPHD